MEYRLELNTSPVYLMAKPTGAVCNLDCTYCYYLEKEKLYPKDPQKWQMSYETLESFVIQYINSSIGNAVQFTWHGGEALMRGRPFFDKVLELQKKYANGKYIENTLQTNGTNLNEEWCRFFKDNKFLIGVSIDGPEHCHDYYRRYKDGKPSFARVMKGIELMQRFGVDFNTLSVVNDYNARFPLEVYRFLKSIGSHFMQFTPIVERISTNPAANGLVLLAPEEKSAAIVTDWSVKAVDYGNFLIKIFDEWVMKDVGEYFVITFDCVLANWMRVPPSLCIYAETCGHAGAVEYNGDVYSCDHYVFPEFKLGNIKNDNLLHLMRSEFQQKFGNDKKDKLPGYCKKCEFLDLCHGECPKNRIINAPDGEPGLNYLCAGFKKFYRHTEPYFNFMANELMNKRSPANVKNWAASYKR
ncbi:MAG: anaerobic sulfatase-maturation protein [Bacteroidales bacterium]